MLAGNCGCVGVGFANRGVVRFCNVLAYLVGCAKSVGINGKFERVKMGGMICLNCGVVRDCSAHLKI